MKSVLLTCQSGTYAGVERRLVLEAAVLRDAGFETWLAPARFPGSPAWIREMSDAGVKQFNWKPYKFIERQQAYFPFDAFGMYGRARLRHAGFALAHVALPWTRVGLSRVYDLGEAGVPVVLSVHCTFPKESWKPRLTPYIRRALGGVVAAYAVSEPARESFIANFSELTCGLDIQVIDNGVNTVRFHPLEDGGRRADLRAKLGVPADAFLVVFCGRLDEFKNPQLALEAFVRASRQRHGLRLILLGDGPLRRHLETQVLGTEHQQIVHFAGFVENVAMYLQAADLYVSTSSSAEGFPLAPAEALACGVPILIPDNAPFEYAFARCPVAVLVGGHLVDHWAAELIRCVDRGRADKDDEVSWAARTYAVKYVNEESMKSRLSAFYSRFLA